MSSCSKNEVIKNQTDAANALDFGVYTGVSTKGAVTADAYAGFGVLGYYTDEDAWSGSNSEAPNFMYNQKVSSVDNGSTWTYSPIKYWTNENSDKISSFAYAPYIDGTTVKYATLSKANIEGTPTLTFDYSADGFDMESTTDFVAGNAIDKTQDSDGDGVNFTLKHELTRVALSVKLSAALAEKVNSTVVVKSIKFDGNKVYNKGVYTFGNTNGAVGSWALSQEGTSPVFEMITYMENYNNTSVSLGAGTTKYAESGVLLTTANAETLGSDNYVFALPAYIAGTTKGANDDVKLTIVYDVVTADAALANGSYSAIENTKTFSLTSTSAATLVQGVAYSYNLTISLNEVELSATVVDTWGTESDKDLTVEGDDATLSE